MFYAFFSLLMAILNILTERKTLSKELTFVNMKFKDQNILYRAMFKAITIKNNK